MIGSRRLSVRVIRTVAGSLRRTHSEGVFMGGFGEFVEYVGLDMSD